VDTAWQTLRDGGVPLAMAPSGGAITVEALAAAAQVAVAGGPVGREAEALAAWLFAWQQHWPDGFRAAFGEGGSSWSGRRRSSRVPAAT